MPRILLQMLGIWRQRCKRQRPHKSLVNSGSGASDGVLLATSDGRLELDKKVTNERLRSEGRKSRKSVNDMQAWKKLEQRDIKSQGKWWRPAA